MGGQASTPTKTDEQIKEEMQTRWSNMAQEKLVSSSTESQTQVIDNKQKQISLPQQQEQQQQQQQTLYKPIQHPQEIEQPSTQTIQIKQIEHKEEVNQPKVVQEDKEEKTQLPDQFDKEKPKQIINEEHAAIKKVFKICLDEEEKAYCYLELYHAQLLSQNKEAQFEIDSLDEIILDIINNTEYKNDLLNYLLKCYYRAYTIIEINCKGILGDEFKTILTVIATTIGQLIAAPSNYNIILSKEKIKDSLTNYYKNSDKNEVLSLCDYIVVNSSSDDFTLSSVFFYFFNIIHLENVDHQTFFKCDKINKNTLFLIELFNRNNVLRRIYVKESNYIPINIDGRMVQTISFLGPLISLVPFETDANTIRTKFKPQMTEVNDQVRVYGNTLNRQLALCTDIISNLIEDQSSSEMALNYFCHLISLNTTKTKMHVNMFTTSSNGFLLNSSLVCIQLFFNECKKCIKSEDNNDKVDFYLQIGKLIDLDFCITNNIIPFNKFEFINSPEAKAYMTENGEKCQLKEYNLITKLFFITHAFIRYYIEQLDKEYTQVIQGLNECGTLANPKFKDFYSMYCSYDIYIKNAEVISKLMSFNELTYIILFTLNNSKYTHLNIKDDVSSDSFYSDFYNNVDPSNIVPLSILPNLIIKNIVYSSLLFRKYSSDLYFKDPKEIKSVIYFSIIYSSNVNLIHNPHLRSEVFDILIYTFMVNEKEKGANHIHQINAKLLQDPFVKSNLIPCLMRVFVDAERLGTSNQFYEKFSIRNKVISLIENIFKRHQAVFNERIVEYAKDNDVTQLLNLLMNDVTYLVDEVIQKLSDIKVYEDLIANKEEFDKLDADKKEIEVNKFNENDRLAKSEVYCLNSSLGFMVIMCQCLQKYFINIRLAERLSNLLNYVLDEFTAKASKLKIKNKAAYDFNPSSIFSSLIRMYVAFKDYKEFHDYVVSDQRSYKYDNFLTAINIKNTKMKIKLDFETGEIFETMVHSSFKEAEERVKMNQIDYSDAPEEFIDQITSEIMDDPVLLPTSKIIVDRISIETHLLSDPIDPFNRMPLTKEMLIPENELKEKIKKYKEEKKKQKENEIKGSKTKDKQIEEK